MSGTGAAAGWRKPAPSYDPSTAAYLDFASARRAFAAGEDDPRRFLERCLERIAEGEPSVRAFVSLDPDGARAAADASAGRWRSGRPRSAVDGMPVGVKDCFDVRGLPTRLNSALFADHVAAFDAAHVDALRRGGAAILGKTVTTELTMAGPGPTCNPWDLGRTPGGSSSGSAAAVAAAMLPLATGSQVRGSVIRPASICGILGMKPSFGALNRHGGFDPSPSLNHLGLLAGTLTDLWEAAQHVAAEVGGDPGCAPLAGGPKLPEARKPRRLVRQYTAGWEKTDAASQSAFEAFLRDLAAKGVEVVEPDADLTLAAYEAATTAVPEFFFDLMLWECRWPLLSAAEARPDALSATVHGYVGKAATLTVADYRQALDRQADLRRRHRSLAGRTDGFVTLAHIGPGQLGHPAVGTPWYNDASSAIGAPSLNLPLLAVEGLPLGIQIMGFEGADEELVAQARWFLEAFGTGLAGSA